MRVTVVHETVYRYESPADYSVQYLRLSPRSTSRQKVISWRLEAPAAPRPWADAFGNDAHLLVVARPHAEIKVRARGEVEVEGDEGQGTLELGPQAAEVYLRSTPLTQADAALASFAADFRKEFAADRVKGLERLMTALRDRVEYRPGVTHAATAAADAFGREAGVCQDHAHIFLACARLLEVPARYVSGYLAAQGTDHLASHAWVETWISGVGWLGYDIANRTMQGGRHVQLAVGLDYLDACPVRGFRRGGAGESMAVEVHVQDAQRARGAQLQGMSQSAQQQALQQAAQKQAQQQQQ